MSRYVIIARETFADRPVVLVEVETNPEAIATALRRKTILIGRKRRMPQYTAVRVVDNGPRAQRGELK
jgi:hypothetical protein